MLRLFKTNWLFNLSGVFVAAYIILCFGLVAVIGAGIWKGSKYISKHGLKSVAERIWNGNK